LIGRSKVCTCNAIHHSHTKNLFEIDCKKEIIFIVIFIRITEKSANSLCFYSKVCIDDHYSLHPHNYTTSTIGNFRSVSIRYSGVWISFSRHSSKWRVVQNVHSPSQKTTSPIYRSSQWEGKINLLGWRVSLYFYSPSLNSTRIWRVGEWLSAPLVIVLFMMLLGWYFSRVVRAVCLRSALRSQDWAQAEILIILFFFFLNLGSKLALQEILVLILNLHLILIFIKTEF
jgi:hypothetical protein